MRNHTIYLKIRTNGKPYTSFKKLVKQMKNNTLYSQIFENIRKTIHFIQKACKTNENQVKPMPYKPKALKVK